MALLLLPFVLETGADFAEAFADAPEFRLLDWVFPDFEAEPRFKADLEVGVPTDFFFTAFFATTDAT